jgi:acetyl-CoA/propionyl-CoA carboxylase, biotin carboxylase, biotin carboxyl carrier protein
MARFDRILIANRGEIALRIARTCRDLGITSVAVYGEGEHNDPHVRYADEAYRLETDAAIPYLDIDAVLDVATRAAVPAIHPGYGFLAENPAFSERCARAGVTFIGPPAGAIESMGDKIQAREIARRAGVPVVPGSGETVETESVAGEAESIGYPVAIKAAAGGGGRGFRVAFDASELPEALDGASGEARRYFSDGRVYIERYLESPRHVEIQVLCDLHGNALALGERDCSIQRRHQKLIEEAPSPILDVAMRERMEEAAVRLARAVDYVGAGTVEFLVQGDEFYFLEMNTRIQVEHPVTEMIGGVDLISEQIRIACGEPIDVDRFAFRFGHAIECRINAEDASAGFQPVSGQITGVTLPHGPGIRFDGIAEPGLEVSPRYDSLLGKLVIWGRDRAEALGRLNRALRELEITGIATTIPFHRSAIDHPAFQSGDYDTRFLERYPEVLEGVAAVAANSSVSADSLTTEPTAYQVEVNGRRFDVRVYLPAQPKRRPPVLSGSRGSATVAPDGSETIISPIQGTVLSVAVGEGDVVRAGDVICVIEAMKMENEISAGRDGRVSQLQVQAGTTIEAGATVAVIESGHLDQ